MREKIHFPLNNFISNLLLCGFRWHGVDTICLFIPSEFPYGFSAILVIGVLLDRYLPLGGISFHRSAIAVSGANSRVGFRANFSFSVGRSFFGGSDG